MTATPASTDAIERESSRPDFAGLFAAWPGSQKITDFRFSKKTPPIYIAHTEDDTTAKIAFARGIDAELRKADVPVKAEYFGTGGHTAFTIGGGHTRRLAATLPALADRNETRAGRGEDAIVRDERGPAADTASSFRSTLPFLLMSSCNRFPFSILLHLALLASCRGFLSANCGLRNPCR